MHLRTLRSGSRAPGRPALLRRAWAWLCVLGLGAGAGAGVARADEPPAPDPIVGTWAVDVAATAKGISEAAALDLDALPPAERAEELLRRETFSRALRLVATPDGAFRLGIPDEAARATLGAWVSTGPGAYRLTLRARFGVPVAGAEAGPFEARLEGGALSYRDRDGTRLVLKRPLPSAPAPAAPLPPPVPAGPTPGRDPVPGAHPAAYVAVWELDRDRMIDVALDLARKQLDALEPDQRKMAEAMLLGDQARDMMRRQLEAMEIRVDLHADGTLAATLGLPGQEVEEATGTWKELEGKVTLTLETKNGRPAAEADRKPVDGRLEGAILWLEMRGDGPAIPLRKSVR